jgi:hypothetical protein
MKNKLVLSAAIVSLLAFASCKKADTSLPLPPEAITVIPQSAVPAAVVATFTANFADATQVEWSKSSSSGFEVEFNHQGERHDATFDDSGHQNSHHISCIGATVPQVVLTAFRTRNPNDNVYEWNLRNDGTWKAHFTRNGVTWETTFSASGVFIKEEHA